MVDRNEKSKAPGKLMSTLGYANVVGAIGGAIGLGVGALVGRGKGGLASGAAKIGAWVGAGVGTIVGGVQGYRTASAGQRQFEEVKQENAVLEDKVEMIDRQISMATAQKPVLGAFTQNVADERADAAGRARV